MRLYTAKQVKQEVDAANKLKESLTCQRRSAALDCISRQAAIDALDGEIEVTGKANAKAVLKYTQMISDRIKALPSARPDARLKKIADLVDGTIDHFDRDDAMDLLYQIKDVLKNG